MKKTKRREKRKKREKRRRRRRHDERRVVALLNLIELLATQKFKFYSLKLSKRLEIIREQSKCRDERHHRRQHVLWEKQFNMILRHSKKAIYRQFDISKKSSSSNISDRFENNIHIWWFVSLIDDISTTSRVQTREYNDNKIETIWDLFTCQIFAFELWKNKIH